MPTIHTSLYDTAVFSTVAGAEFILFQVPQGGDATHTESFTNMRGAGSLPQNEKFIIQKIEAFPDYAIPAADVMVWFRASKIQVRIADQIMFDAPLADVVGHASYGGSDTTTAGANGNRVGLLGDGWDLEPDITIGGGTPFRIRVIQGTAVAAGSSNIKVVLKGLLTFGQS